MGNGAGVDRAEEYTAKLEAEVNLMTPHLPVAELLNGGIIRLTGYLNFFNVDSLLEPSWLKGKLTVDEYRAAIKYINTCSIRSQQSRGGLVYSTGLMKREQAKAAACTAAVAEINRRHPGVRFTYQQGTKDVLFHSVWSLTLASEITSLYDRYVRRGPEAYIYININ